VSPDYCEECGSHLLAVTFNKKNSPLPGDELEKTACLACDELFNSLTEAAQSKGFFRRSPKGKGKGKKGKGKGKGRSADDEAEERGRKLALQGKRR